MAHSSDSDSSLDALPRHLRARCLRRLMRQQLVELLRAPARRSRRGRGHASRRAAARKAARAASSDSSTLATRRGPPVMPDVCTAPERILVQSPRHCPSHGWTARVRLPQEMPPVVTAFCHDHGGWANFARRFSTSTACPHVPRSPGRSRDRQCLPWPTPHHQDRARPGQDERRRRGKSPLTLW
jgi:hypothetical protein